MYVSLIATVLNEGESIRRLMDSIVAQTKQPDEVIICDGGSTDNTIAVLEEYADRLPLRIVVQPGANISEGRNIAIQHTTHDVIAVTDAGVRLASDWLHHLTLPFETTPDTRVVAGFFLPDTKTPFEIAMGATVLPALQDVNPAAFMPSSRSVAFYRNAVLDVGGYPEWLDFCEDLILDFRLHAKYAPFGFAPDAIAYFLPRTSLQAFIKQYYQYSRGDGKANLFLKRHVIRYFTYFFALPLLIIVSILHSPWWGGFLLAGAFYMVWRPYIRLFEQWRGLSTMGKLSAFFWVPIIRIVGDIAKMAGYPVGIKWRMENSPPEWRINKT